MLKKIITFKDVSFRYSGENGTVLDGSSFSLCKGDRLVLKGASGTGKTTLFRLILGFEKPDKGNIFFKNQPLNTDTIQRLRKDSAWLPQDLNLGSGTVKEVLSFPFEFSENAASSPKESDIQQVFKQLGLEPSMMQNQFSELSTGQRQRVGIAICYLLHKPLLLLDEPTSALDKASKQRVIDLLFKNSERTILSTSHDPYWIEQCNKVIELE